MASTTPSSRFTQVSLANLPSLISLLEQKMSNSARMLNIAILSLNQPETKFKKLYCLNGNLTDLKDAFILFVHLSENAHNPGYVIIEHPDPEELRPDMLLALEDLLDWNEPILLSNVDPICVPHFTDLVAKHNLGRHAPPFELCYTFLLTAEESLNLDAEADRQKHQNRDSIVIRQLSVNEVNIVSQNWWNGQASEIIRSSIVSVASAGVYVNEELVSWALGTPSGSINAVHTKEAYRKQGYANLAMKYLCKLLGTRGLHAVTLVVCNNSSSIKLMEKLGFVRTHTTVWIDYCHCSDCSAGQAASER